MKSSQQGLPGAEAGWFGVAKVRSAVRLNSGGSKSETGGIMRLAAHFVTGLPQLEPGGCMQMVEADHNPRRPLRHLIPIELAGPPD